MKLGDKIRIIRKARGLSQTDLGFLLSESGVSRQAVSSWENDNFEPKLENIKDLAKVYNVSIDALLDEDIDLNNPSVLQSVLNNDYINDSKHKIPVSISMYRSYKILSVLLGLAIVGVFVFLYIYGKNVLKSIEISEIEAPETATNILGGLQALQEYVVKVAARDNELEALMVKMFTYVTYISLALLVSFVALFAVILIKSKRKVSIMSQNNIVIYKRKLIYIKFSDVKEIKKNFFGLKIITEDKTYKVLFISNKDEILSFYNQLKLINEAL